VRIGRGDTMAQNGRLKIPFLSLGAAPLIRLIDVRRAADGLVLQHMLRRRPANTSE
jgi:hypothetical protein